MKGENLIGLLLPLAFIVLCVLSIWYAVDSTEKERPDVSGVVWRDVTGELLEAAKQRDDAR